MKPEYKIEANNQDVTDTIARRLISFTLQDNEGLESDSLEIVLDDRDNAIAVPPNGCELKVFIGYWETGLVYKGLFIFDGDIGIDGPPDKMVIRATAAHAGNTKTIKGFNAGLKAHKTRSWHEVDLKSIVETIATEAGYEARVDEKLGEEVISHIDQTDESDMHFLTRLAKDRNAVAKPAGGFFIFVPKGKSTSATGRKVDGITLKRPDLTSWNMGASERGRFPAVTAYWQDLASGERVPETAGAGEPIKKLRGNFPTQAEAQRAAEAELRRIELGKATPSFSFPGWPELAAEGLVEIEGLRDPINGKWSITKATHNFSSTGYMTSIECELPEED